MKSLCSATVANEVVKLKLDGAEWHGLPEESKVLGADGFKPAP